MSYPEESMFKLGSSVGCLVGHGYGAFVGRGVTTIGAAVAGCAVGDGVPDADGSCP